MTTLNTSQDNWMEHLGPIRHDWTREEIENIYISSIPDLVYHAGRIHRQYFDPNSVQISTLLNMKTGGCPEDCKFCSQSGHFKTDIKKQIKNMPVEDVIAAAKKAKATGATRFCVVAAWRHLFDKDVSYICELIGKIKTLGLETCFSLGMLTAKQAEKLSTAGLDYYNHNLETSAEYYSKIVTTHTYQDRLDTVAHVQKAGVKACCGGILGLGETREDRVGLLHQLATHAEHPKSVPINVLIAIPGTPLEEEPRLNPIEFIRAIATARITMPKSFVRLTGGRVTMSHETQALCFLAGANSIHLGEKLLTTPNPDVAEDYQLLDRLGMTPMPATELSDYA